jgi:hypothetical protein
VKRERSLDLKRISNWLYRVSTGLIALISLVIFILFITLILPDQSSKLEMRIGSAGSPDTSFIYSATELYHFAEVYGETGREAYVRARFSFDLIWPLVYTLFLSTSISWVLSRAFTPGSMWKRVNLVPILGLVFDYLENLSTSLVMLRYPDRTAVVDILAPVFTLIKWVFVIGSFVLLIIGFGAGIWKWMKNRTK